MVMRVTIIVIVIYYNVIVQPWCFEMYLATIS